MRTYLLILLLIGTFCAEEFPTDKDVIILTDETFDKALDKYEHLLVMFYAPWCGHCKKMHPEFEKAAATLKKEELYLAKVDATTEKKLAERFAIQGFPTVKLFNKGVPLEYNGGRKEKEIVNWMRKKTGPVTKELKTKDEITKFIDTAEVSIIYFGTDKTKTGIFANVARQIEDYPFGTVAVPELFKEFKAEKDTVVLFKKFDEKRNELKEIKEKDLTDFINKYSSPRVMKFDDKAAQIIFGKNIPAIILYADKKSAKWSDFEKIMNNVSEKIEGKLKVVLTDIKDGMAARLAEYIGVKESDLPTCRIADTKGDLKKYNMEGEITEQNILKFVKDWEEKKLKAVYKTEEIPKENNGDVFVVVGKSFEQEVIKNDKDVMLLFYAKWCGHCKALHPKYEEVARKLKKNKKLLLAKIDATENEVESVTISGFPTVKFYPGNKKDIAPIEYNGDRTVEDIISFIKKNAFNPIVVEETKKEETKKEETKKEEPKKDEKKPEPKKDEKKVGKDGKKVEDL